MNTIIKILEYTDNHKLLSLLLTPLIFIFEKIYDKKIWKNDVLKCMITNDNIFDFLDKEDFELKNNKLRKIALLSDNEYYDINDTNVTRTRIRKDYVMGISEIVTKNVNYDIDDYIALIVNIDTKFVEEHGEYFRGNVYEIIIQSIRYERLRTTRIRFILYNIILIILIGIITILIHYVII